MQALINVKSEKLQNQQYRGSFESVLHFIKNKIY